MLLRNYDNYKAASSLANSGNDFYLSTLGFGDGILSIKNTSGSLRGSVSVRSTQPFTNFITYNPKISESGSEGYSNLICCFLEDGEEVTYDDYTMPEINNLKFVSHSWEPVVYDEDHNEWSRVYKKVIANTNATPVTINCIGVVYRDYNYPYLIYKKRLEHPIEVPANGNAVLTFTTTVGANPHRPADYNVSASIE